MCCSWRAGGYNYALHEAPFPVDLTFPIAVCATFFVSLLVLLYVIHQRLQACMPHTHAPSQLAEGNACGMLHDRVDDVPAAASRSLGVCRGHWIWVARVNHSNPFLQLRSFYCHRQLYQCRHLLCCHSIL